MRKKMEYGLYILFFLLTILSVLFCIQSDLSHMQETNLRPIRIEGGCSINGGSYRPLTADTDFSVSDYYTVVIEGNFSQDIPVNQQLMIRLSNVLAVLEMNGETIYTNRNRIGTVSRSPGNGWASIPSPGISTGDAVTLTLSNVYKKGNPETFSHAVNEMYAGYESDLARFIFRQSVSSFLFGLLTVPLGTLLFLAGIFIKQQNRERIFSLALFCFSVGVWILADPVYMTFFFHAPDFTSAVAQIAQFLQLVSITKFVHSIVRNKVRKAVGLIHWSTFLLFAASVLCQLLGLRDYYDFTYVFMALNAVVCIGMLWALIVETIGKNQYAGKTLLSILPLGIFSLAEQMEWAAGYYYDGFFTKIGFTLFLVIQAVYTVKESRILVYRLEQVQYTERKLAESRIAAMMSQIQPHFLFNSLTGIKQLCDTDPKRASDALERFSFFLRGNIDSLSNHSMIPFEKEMSHVQDYLYLEKIRFGDRLSVRMEFETTGFLLPPLTLQPIVENAVQRGIMKKREGGEIVMKNRRTGEGIVITVTDNGIGFDTDKEKQDGRLHVGISNVRERLNLQCGGTLSIKSRIGEGTEVTIILPERRSSY